jgi:hypothetical protein
VAAKKVPEKDQDAGSEAGSGTKRENSGGTKAAS